jgi:hypothetical protein
LKIKILLSPAIGELWPRITKSVPAQSASPPQPSAFAFAVRRIWCFLAARNYGIFLLLAGLLAFSVYAQESAPTVTNLWKFNLPDNGTESSPAPAPDGTVYFGSWDNSFYALNAKGSLKWKFVTGAPVIASRALGADGTVYISSTDGKFCALKPDGK